MSSSVSFGEIGNDNVQSHIIKGWWKDTGKLEDILEANRLILDTLKHDIQGKIDNKTKLEGKVILEKGAIIKNSYIRGPVVIGAKTKIIDSYIGPYTSIYYNVKIENSEIDHSIVLEESIIENIKRIDTSLIGKNVVIKKTNKKPAAYRLMVGDSGRVELQ